MRRNMAHRDNHDVPTQPLVDGVKVGIRVGHCVVHDDAEHLRAEVGPPLHGAYQHAWRHALRA